MFVWGGDDNECSCAVALVIIVTMLEVMNMKVYERKRTNENNNGNDNNYENKKITTDGDGRWQFTSARCGPAYLLFGFFVATQRQQQVTIGQ